MKPVEFSSVGYSRKQLQILGGGYNPLPPVDKTPITDYLLAQNWRVDTRGKLVSRYGYQRHFSITGAKLAHSGAVHGGINGAYYVGCNSAISSPTGSLYWNLNSSAIATGFDGNRIGFAFMNGWCWFMNRGNQGRHKDSLGAGTSQTWNLAAPGNSPTASSAANPGTSASVTYTYTLQGNPDYVHFLTINGTPYQFAENGYSAAQLPLVIASMASQDPNASVYYDGTPAHGVVITPKLSNLLVQVSGSDGNAATNLANGTVTSLPNGTYTFYVTFQTSDLTLESNPSASSGPVALANQSVTLNNIPTSADSRMTGGRRNIYAIGGTLASAYLVGAIPDNATISWTFSFSDLDATNGGIVMPIDNDPAPAAAGLAGPHFSRLFAWSTAANPNRLFYTNPNEPQYWPGSNDPAVGNWVDVGTENEAIVWCTIHGNLLVIYKERSVWMLVGDPSTGYLQCMNNGLGLVGQFAVCEAGPVDYVMSSAGLYLFNMDKFVPVSGVVLPLLTTGLSNAGATLSAPGGILPGTAFNSTSTSPYAVSLGYALGKLYVSYAERVAAGTSYMLLVYNEQDGRWFYHRNALSNTTGFFGFMFDGEQMVGLSGTASGAAVGHNLDDFTVFATTDPGATAISCIYQSHYENCGLPETPKVWMEVVIDLELNGGDTATLYVGAEAGNVAPVAVGGSISGSGRISVNMPLATNNGTGAVEKRVAPSATQTDGFMAKSLSVAVVVAASSQVVIHNVYLYHYEEARLSQEVVTLASDLGIGKVKQAKELVLDIDTSAGACVASIYTDLPGNVMALQQSLPLASNTTRALLKYPFTVTEGYLWKVAIAGKLAAGAVPGFRLYSAKLLMRVIGTYVEAYEAAAGFVWDSMEQTFESGLTHIPRGYAISLASQPIKRARELTLEIETFNQNVTVTLLTDLPGNAQASRFTGTVNTGISGRRIYRMMLPGATSTQIEGRIFRLQLSGTNAFRLYSASIEIIAIGVYVEAYEATAGAVYDSRELDFGTPAVKEARELELDIEVTGGNISAQVISDISWTANVETPGVQAIQASSSTVTTSGRQKVLIPLTVNAALDQFVEGRLLRTILTGSNAFRLYGARLKVRTIGTFIDANEMAGGALWDSTDLDLGTQSVKQLRQLDLDITAYGAFTVNVYTDLPGNVMTLRVTKIVAATSGRTKVEIPLPQGSVPDNYTFGRLVRVTITSASALKLFGARIHSRAIGVYVESYEAAGGAVWDSTPQDLGNTAAKYFDELHVELDTDGPASVAIYTDLPGEAMSLRYTAALTTGATGRHWSVVQLPSSVSPFLIEGRSIRLVISSSAGFRLYRVQVSAAKIPQYLAALPASGQQDVFNTLEYDFESGTVKVHKKLEIDTFASGVLTISAYTEQTGQLSQVWTANVTTPNGRMTLWLPLPPGIRGRLLRIGFTSPAAARVYRIRTWSREVNRADAQWAWDAYPMDACDINPAKLDLPLPQTPPDFSWSELPVEPTKPEWQWAELPVNPTEKQWFWAKFLTVEETPDTWQLVDVPFEVVG